MTADHLGSPRLITNGSGAVVSRHDYQPFGEELFEGMGGRTSAQGYGAEDGLRKQFTSKERDAETGLDYFLARYYASIQGRFTSCDPLLPTKRHVANPQLWNMYVYVLNNPLSLYDPDGRIDHGKGGGRVIDVFITLPDKNLRMDWRGLERLANNLRKEGKVDVKLNLYSVGAGQVNAARVERSLKTPDRFTVIIGHSMVDQGHPSGQIGEGVQVGNGYIGTFGVTVGGPDQAGVDHPLPTINAEAFMVVTCYPGEGFINTVQNNLSSDSEAWYNDGGSDGTTSIEGGERAGYEMVRSLVLGQEPAQAAAAATNVLQNSPDRQDRNGDTVLILIPEQR